MGPVQGLGVLGSREGTQRSPGNQPVCHRATAGAVWGGAEPGPALLGAVGTEPSPPSPLHGQEMAPSPGVMPQETSPKLG